MKKTVSLLLCLALLPGLAGCAQRLQLGFTGADVARMYIYTGSVPADAWRMVVTQREDIDALVAALEDLTLLRRASEADETAGGLGFIIHLALEDGGSRTLHLNGRLLRHNGATYVVKGSQAFEQLYALLGYELVFVAEDALPQVA